MNVINHFQKKRKKHLKIKLFVDIVVQFFLQELFDLQCGVENNILTNNTIY